jgi:hypothetical protein
LGESFCLEHLRGEVLGVGVEVAHEALEVGGVGSGGEGRAAPVVEERAGEGFAAGWGEFFDDEFSAAEAGVGVASGDEEGDRGAVLLGQARLDLAGVGVELGGGDGSGFCASGQAEEQAVGCREDSGDFGSLHELDFALTPAAKQCMDPHAVLMDFSPGK